MLAVTALGLLVLVIAALVALSVHGRGSGAPGVTNFVEISNQGHSTVDPFANQSTPTGDSEPTPSRTQ
jgi:hypothetical protein